jgi:Xaa-Pro aminopeptidase
MKSDLDAIMKKQKIDTLLISGPVQHNPAMVYFTGIVHITNADLVKKAGQPAILFHPPMERDEALRTGLKTRTYNDYPMNVFMAQAGDDRNLAVGLRYEKMLVDCGVTSGRIALYGNKDQGSSYAAFYELQKLMPDAEFTGFVQDELLMQAMMTKDEDEINRIRKMAKITVETVRKTKELLISSKVKDGVLLDQDGKPLTIGKVKSQIDLWLAEQGAENPEGTIFAIGRDGGVPHSSGTPTDKIELGKPIVFDIYPCEAGGGYYYDFTRTWCLGYAPTEVEKLYQQVRSVYDTILKELKFNTPLADYQKHACELFKAMGHATIAENPATENGYVHSLSHGIGLHIHEKPFSGMTATETDVIYPGSVFTVEPGLYYPDKGMGVRLENSVIALKNGTFEIPGEFPLDLVLPMKS